MRLAFVVQRYGHEVNGGAELHCRMLAERLRKREEVRAVSVFTSCAADYQTWKNVYPAGVEQIAGVNVERFPVLMPRVRPLQRALAAWIMGHRHPRWLELAWLFAQGPVMPGLMPRLKRAQADYDAFIFFTYLYFPTVFGLQAVARKSILVPTAHDEPPIYLDVFRDVFAKAGAIAYNTPEERDFVVRQFGLADTPSAVIGCGVDLRGEHDGRPTNGSSGRKLRGAPVPNAPYVLYLGRVDRSKGVEELCRAFVEFKDRNSNTRFRCDREYLGRELVLRIAGGGEWAELPRRSDIVREGFVDAERKLELLRDCEALALPSRYESLSLVVLEAWTMQKPVLVESDCAVTSGHVARSGGGFAYHGPLEFSTRLAELLASPELRANQGAAGRSYVADRYAWSRVEERLLELARGVSS
jgi:glycosyltransferase involved in cell wall biosynthesis